MGEVASLELMLSIDMELSVFADDVVVAVMFEAVEVDDGVMKVDMVGGCCDIS